MTNNSSNLVPVIPDSAPFTAEQRAWLNGFLAGLFSKAPAGHVAASAPPRQEEAFPWHDPALALPERLALAEGKPLSRRMMAAMAQLDCGSCGSSCREYAEAIASGTEADFTKCSPGGKDTSRKLKELAAELTISPSSAGKAHKPVHLSAHLLAADRLTAPSSAKDVRHVVIDLNGSKLSYDVGDALSVQPHNCTELVQHTLDLLSADPDQPVTAPSGETLPLSQALASVYSLAAPSDNLISLLAHAATDAEERSDLLKHISGDGYPDGIHVPDILALYPSARPPIGEILQCLTLLQPRLYSISSSLKSNPGQVHLTVGVVKYTNPRDRLVKGVASTFLAERLPTGQTLGVQVHPAKAFRLPADPATPIIMVGPGTGIAPFRAFLHERAATGASGKNWLFFGDQRRDSDFLYREELETFQKQGVLTRLSLAFSRDQAEKVYVQHRMLEEAAELFSWLESGAHFYVCGDAKRMARDVDAALHTIIEHQGRLSPEAAKQYVTHLKSQSRYQRDVY